MNKQLGINRQVSEPLSITQAKNTTKFNSDSEWEVGQLIQLQQQRSEQLESLKATSIELARLEMQVKKIKCADTILTNCDQCVGNELNLCGKCMLYIGGQIERLPNSPDAIEKAQLRIADLDEGQEDAYWL